MLAPIALFVYNRLMHTRQTVEALQKNTLASESDLVIFSDAPKTELQTQAVNDVRRYIRQVDGFKSVKVIERTENYGLASSIINGVTSLCDEYSKVIVLEDDMVISRYFLQYMNDGLNKYADNARIACIHGYQFPVKERLPETFFLRGADCWGWATWARAWYMFEPNGQALLQQLQARKLTNSFDLDGAYPYTRMLEEQISGRNDSWAVRWRASCFLRDMLTLYSGQSLVNNIGNDASGTHCGDSSQFSVDIRDSKVPFENIPIEENRFARDIIARFLRPSLASRVIGAMQFGLGRIRKYV